jgi:hypothetical protein
MLGYILSFILPFVTSDEFRACSDYTYETLQPASVQPSDTIFITTHQLEPFFTSVHPAIRNPYILISHVTDEPAPGPFASFLEDPKLLAWFVMNYDGTSHPKLHPIPIGLAHQDLPHGNLDIVRQVIEKTQQLPKRHLLFMNFTIQTFSQERWEVFKLFSRAPFCFRTGKKPFHDYLIDMALSKFVLAPRGMGLDTYRLWEALYVGSIPIVKTSSLDILYEGLPVLIVSDWNDVTEEFLEQKYLEFAEKKFPLEKLRFSYWKTLIKNEQKK